jgi:SAM-dependent methyltransferase
MRDEQRAAAALWALGDYAQMGARLRPAATRLAEAVGDGHGRRALDVATGTGSMALELAARGWAVSATDLCEPLVAQAVSVARQAGHAIDFQVAALDEQPHEDAAFAAVTSSFGLIFAPDPGAAVDEIARCLQPGGLLAFTVWLPRGYMAQMTQVMQQFLPPAPAGRHDPLSWGDPEVARARLADLSDVRIHTEQLPWEFASAEEAIDLYFQHSPAHVAAARAAGNAADELRHAVHEHLAAGAGTDGAIRLVADYALVLARRP